MSIRPQRGEVRLIGTSVRAMAESAACSGWQPWACDLYADFDLVRRFPTDRSFGNAFERFERWVLASDPGTPWMFTGGLENHPDFLDELAQRRPLCGGPVESIRQVRDVDSLTDLCGRLGMARPETIDANHPSRTSLVGRWLRKPKRSCGGLNISEWNPHDQVAAEHPEGYVIQRFQPGLPCASLYRRDDRGFAWLGLLGQFRPQLTENKSGHPYRFAGAYGPIETSPGLVDQLRYLGESLANWSGLQGPFGIDGILDGSTFWVLEVNPRYTASMELWEHLSCQTVISETRSPASQARKISLGDQRNSFVALNREVGIKAIIDAPRSLQVDDLPRRWPEMLADECRSRRSWLADLPRPGSRFQPGQPLLTILARAAHVEEAASIIATERVKIREEVLWCSLG